MTKLKLTKEKDFKEIEIEYPDFLVNFTKALNSLVGELENPIPSEDGNSLVILVVEPDYRENYSGVERDKGAGQYTIRVRPCSYLHIDYDEVDQILDENSFKWIKVKRYTEADPRNPNIDWKYEYNDLVNHHKSETEFLIKKCRELANMVKNK
jgi:hypothetical protein